MQTQPDLARRFCSFRVSTYAFAKACNIVAQASPLEDLKLADELKSSHFFTRISQVWHFIGYHHTSSVKHQERQNQPLDSEWFCAWQSQAAESNFDHIGVQCARCARRSTVCLRFLLNWYSLVKLMAPVSIDWEHSKSNPSIFKAKFHGFPWALSSGFWVDVAT